MKDGPAHLATRNRGQLHYLDEHRAMIKGYMQEKLKRQIYFPSE